MSPIDTTALAQIAIVAVGSICALSMVGLLVHAHVDRVRRRSAARPHQTERLIEDGDRLRRLEQAVDAIAVEVERIPEGQRFLTKLHSERVDERRLRAPDTPYVTPLH